MRLLDLLLGRPLATEEADAERLEVSTAIPVLGLDALASAAYGPEALLTVLLPLGTFGLRYVGWLTLPIVGLLLIVWFSYRQTISAYPEGAGAYTVAKENIGNQAALLAAAALTLDFVLNSAVAVSAGVGALVSAVPSLIPLTLPLCLLSVLLLTVVNLRGVNTTGLVFLVPTYGFVLTLLLVIGVGTVRFFEHGGHPAPAVVPAHIPALASTASNWLLLRAFASGCTAMTGIEAVSNSVGAFREPAVPKAKRTLSIVVLILAVLLVGIAFLSRVYQVTATTPGESSYRSVLSQLVAAVVGRGPLYFITIGCVISVLMLSANTSFASCPRLFQALANDGYMPELLVHRGRRLAFSYGIIALSGLATALLVLFGGVTDPLIPLFAVGALLAFTLSQAAMVAHWRKQRSPHARSSMLINGLGASATGLTLSVVLVSKFASGAWLSVVIIGLMNFLFRSVKAHHEFLRKALGTDAPLQSVRSEPPLIVVPLRHWNTLSHKALQFALTLGEEVVVLQVLTNDRQVDDLSGRWQKLVVEPVQVQGLPAPRLVRLRSNYRELYGPVLTFIKELSEATPARQVAVVVPELVEARWFHYFLHSQGASILKALLLFQGNPRIVVVSTPWYLRDWVPERERLKLWSRVRRRFRRNEH
ncbi:MAG TPA: APC family permease [Polyangiaceae bacterium]|nr:APC family permease [Polyangiaceae bacterium]